VLVPAAVRARVGGLDAGMRHNMADLDFGLRASRMCVAVVIAPLTVGRCQNNDQKQSWADPSRPLNSRLRTVISTKGTPPRQWYSFTRRHCGWWWPRYFVGPYVRALTCGLQRRVACGRN
jgi:GT2 family glycosyltransferase